MSEGTPPAIKSYNMQVKSATEQGNTGTKLGDLIADAKATSEERKARKANNQPPQTNRRRPF